MVPLVVKGLVAPVPLQMKLLNLQTKAVGADLLNSWVMHERFLNPCVQTDENPRVSVHFC